MPPYDANVIDAAEGGRLRDGRQDEHGRVRDGLQRRELRLRPHAQPLGAGPRARRLLVRLSGGRRRGHGLLRPRLRHRRLHPPAGRPLGRRRLQADVRARLPLRPRRLRLLARPDRPVHALRARRRPRLRGDRRPRPARLHLRAAWRCRPSPTPSAATCAACASACRGSTSSRAWTTPCARPSSGAIQQMADLGARDRLGGLAAIDRRTPSPSTTSSPPPRPRRTWPATTA